MTGLSFELGSHLLLNSEYLKISITDPFKRVLSEDKLPLYALKNAEKEALEMLIAEEKRFRTRTSGDKTSVFSVCRVSPHRAFELVKALGITGRLLWSGRKVVVDPFAHVEICIEAAKEERTLCLAGKWRSGERSGPLTDCEWIFAGDGGFCIKNHCIYPLSGDSDRSWIGWVYPKPTLFEGAEVDRVLKNLPDPSQILWIGSDASFSKKIEEPTPFLVLCDRHGAFADLWFDYGEYGKIAVHDEKHVSWRNRESEKGWEKDLLETDFIKKILDSSHYYCPLDKVSKSLSFILDMGWKIYDHRKKLVLRQKKEQIETEITASHILVRGKIHYDTHTADLKDFVGAFNRKERFVDLSPDAVGLLETEGMEKWEGIAEHELIAETIAIKKYRVGQLAPLFASEKISPDYSELFRSLPEGWKMATGEVSSAFQGELFAYQREGVKWLEFLKEGRCGGLLADEMGLGKTVQIVAFFSQLQLCKPSLIVVPTSLLFNWKREFERFLPSCPVCVFAGKERNKNSDALSQPQVILTSYAILRLEAEALKAMDYQVIVLDEAQVIKNPESQIAQIACSLESEMRVAVTGTPIENRLDDLWSLFHFLLPDLLGKCNAFQAALHAASSDVRYIQQIKRKLRPFLLRRKKEGVLAQLPPKMEQVVWVDMTEEQRTRYDQWLHQTKAGLIQKVSLDGISAHRMEILEAILRLRQLCVHPWLVEKQGEGDLFSLSGKCERLFLDLEEAIEEGKKVLVYSQFTTMLHLIRREVANKGWSHVYLDGATSDREAVVRQFQEEKEVSLFLISLKAGGVGLNLTAADYVFLLDPWWNEAVEQQAIDRAHRVGRNDTVIARRYITALSIEEKMMHLKKHKVSLAQGLFEESSDLGPLSLNELMQLIVD